MPGSVTQHYHMDRTFTNQFMIANVAVVDTNVVNGAIELEPPYKMSIRLPMQNLQVEKELLSR